MNSPSMPPDAFQLSVEAAEAYEATFVPTLFARWAAPLLDAAGVAPGQTVVDVACGTGIVARTAADRLGGTGRVIGIDVNDGMLHVARQLRPDLEWLHADAQDLPLADHTADVVLCQAALMFFPDPVRALEEMARVVSPAGTVAIQVWADARDQVGWAPFHDAVRHHAGPDAVDLINTYWRLGDLTALTAMCDDAGLRVAHTSTRIDVAVFPGLEAFLTAEVDATPLRQRLSTPTYSALAHDAAEALAPFTEPDGSLELPISGHIVTLVP